MGKRENPYADFRKKMKGAPATPAPVKNLPAIRPAQPVVRLEPTAPEVPVYRPDPKHRFIDRWRAGGLHRDIEIGTRVMQTATKFNEAEADWERSRRELDKERGKRAFLPMEIAAEGWNVGTKLVTAIGAFEKARTEVIEQSDRAAHERGLRVIHFQTERENAGGDLKRAQAKAARASEVGNRKADAALAKADSNVWKHRVQTALYKRQIADLVAPTAEAADDTDPTPIAMRAHMRARRELSEVNTYTTDQIAAIKARAAAENRPLSPHEEELIDQLEDAAAAAASHVRRNGASDLH